MWGWGGWGGVVGGGGGVVFFFFFNDTATTEIYTLSLHDALPISISDILPLGVSLNLPPFLGANKQMEPEEVIQTQQIARLRIHVERAINKIKNFHIRSEEHTSELQSRQYLVCRLLLEKKKE